MAWILMSGPKGKGKFNFAGTFGYFDDAKAEAKELEMRGHDCLIHQMIDEPEYETEGNDND